MGFLHGHRKTTTLVAGLRMSGLIAPMVLDGPINGNGFEAYVRHVPPYNPLYRLRTPRRSHDLATMNVDPA